MTPLERSSAVGALRPRCRLARRAIPDHDQRLLSALPRDQILARGTVELGYTALGGFLVAVTALAMIVMIVEPFTTKDKLEELTEDVRGKGDGSRWADRPIGWTAFVLSTVIVVLTIGRVWSPEHDRTEVLAIAH